MQNGKQIVIAVDFARIYYVSLTLTNAARAGALYASDPATADESAFDSYEDAALADATNLDPPPELSSTSGTDASGRPYVEVTAEYTFSTVTVFPGVPSEMSLRRSVRMYQSAITPNTP